MKMKSLTITKQDPITTSYLKIQKELMSLNQTKSSLVDVTQRLELMEKIGNIATFEWTMLTNKFVFSPNLKSLYGITDKNFKGHRFTDWLPYIHPQDKILLKQELKDAIKKHREVQFEYRIFTSKKQVRWIAIRAKIFYNVFHIPTKVIGVKTNVTEKKEKEIQKDNFISMASHELKTPLTVIKLHQHMLMQKVKNSNQKDVLKSLEKINNSIETLEELIKSLVDVSKIKRGQLPIAKEPIILEKLVKDSVKDLKSLHQNQLIFHSATKAYVLADAGRIQEVVKNLLLNAMKYSPLDRPIVIHVTEQKKHLVVIVKDKGIGIPFEQQGKIFDQFFQVKDHLGETTYPGLGLGLYISNQIIKQHNGKISLKSVEGKGSTFSIHLPIYRKI